jgi:energy-coupling factor transporter ATP-binding protein EcfA2
MVQEQIELELAKRLPKVGDYVLLQSHDGTKVETREYDHKTTRTIYSKNQQVIMQRCAEYGPEYVQFLAGEMRYRQEKGFDNIIMVTGPERAGKSTFAQHLALALDPQLTLDRITFKIKDFNEAIMKAKDGEVIVMDEAGIDLYSQEWWDEFQIELVKKLQVIGIKHLSLILVIPHRLDLNKKIRDRRVQWWINVSIMRHSLLRGFVIVREGVGNEWEQDTFWDTVGACRFNGNSGAFWDEYSKKKLAFVDEINSGEYGVRDGRGIKTRDKAIYLLYQEKDAMGKRKWPQIRLSKELELNQSWVSRIISKFEHEEEQPHPE